MDQAMRKRAAIEAIRQRLIRPIPLPMPSFFHLYARRWFLFRFPVVTMVWYSGVLESWVPVGLPFVVAG